MTYKGTVKDGVVILEPNTSLPDGTEVRVEPVPTTTEPPTWAEVFKDVMGKAQDLPSDLARNHDHYLHGAPKR
jgi:hypothetical protein